MVCGRYHLYTITWASPGLIHINGNIFSPCLHNTWKTKDITPLKKRWKTKIGVFFVCWVMNGVPWWRHKQHFDSLEKVIVAWKLTWKNTAKNEQISLSISAILENFFSDNSSNLVPNWFQDIWYFDCRTKKSASRVENFIQSETVEPRAGSIVVVAGQRLWMLQVLDRLPDPPYWISTNWTSSYFPSKPWKLDNFI